MLSKLSVYLRQYEIFVELSNIFFEYQSWLEEIHFSQHIEDALGDSKDYFMSFVQYIQSIHSSVSNIWIVCSDFVSEQFDRLVSFGPVKSFILALEKISKFSEIVFGKFDLKSSFEEFFNGGIFAKAKCISNMMKRIIGVIFYDQSLVEYDFDYQPENGKFLYRQVRKQSIQQYLNKHLSVFL